MTTSPAPLPRPVLYFALSRTPHALLDMAMPVLAALVWLGRLPPAWIAIVGAIAVFAAYTAVYALNDVVDRRSDRVRAGEGYREAEGYLDAVLPRHPLAHRLLSTRQATVWTVSWAALAAAGAWYLNPICLLIFGGGCLLEAIYCRLCCVTPLRALVSGVVKTLGAVAAVFAVDHRPDVLPLGLLFLWIFLLEIGGQNIPSDWADLEEDKRLGARTIPVSLGERKAAALSVVTLALAVLCQQALLWTLGWSDRLLFAILSVGAGIVLLLIPAFRLLASKDRVDVFRLFNATSFYSLALVLAASLDFVI